MAPRLDSPERNELLSTGKVAKALSVTPDTVLKWIKAGRLPAVRTAGGHYRVSRRDIDGLIAESDGASRPDPARFVHCWEYYETDGGVGERCLECLVYRARAIRCYEMSGLDTTAGYAGAHCTTSCDECAYYREVVRHRRRVLVATDSRDLRRRLRDDDAGTRLELRFAESEYECSAVCAEFRPEVVVIDASMPKRVRDSLCSHLAVDPRIPGVTIVLALPESRSSSAEPGGSFERAVPRTLDLEELERYIEELEVTPSITA